MAAVREGETVPHTEEGPSAAIACTKIPRDLTNAQKPSYRILEFISAGVKDVKLLRTANFDSAAVPLRACLSHETEVALPRETTFIILIVDQAWTLVETPPLQVSPTKSDGSRKQSSSRTNIQCLSITPQK